MINLEIGPLTEPQYTGIPQVTAALAEQMLRDKKNRIGFFCGRQVVPAEAVEGLVTRRNGELFRWHLGRTSTPIAPASLSEPNIAIFPNVKTVRRGFDFEVQIIHDLSSLLTPQFHTTDTIDYHGRTMRDDLLTNDATICVSEATKIDILRYLKPPNPQKFFTVHPGHSLVEDGDELDRSRPGKFETVEPFILILGTIEPRKNIGVVMEFLRRRPGILDAFRFIFVGRQGWGDGFEEYLEKYGLSAAHDQGRVLFTGFVSEQLKVLLMKTARIVIYPSLFEGFGLPVLEAMSLGTPVLTTSGSSLPEVGGDACFYFDPFSKDSFDAAFFSLMTKLETESSAIAERARLQASRFTWPKFYRRVLECVAEVSNGAVVP